MTEIEKYDACEDAVKFRNQFETFEEAWSACPRGDWMLWLAKRLDVDLKTLTLAKVRCASTVRHLMKDTRSIKALDVALLFAEGNATREELDAAYAAADAAAADAADAADAAAADAAAYAAYAAADAAYADAAAYAADAYADAAAYAADAYGRQAARKENQKTTADICREVLTDIVFEKLGLKETASKE